MMHICVSYLGLSPDRRHAIISNHVGKLLVEHPGTTLSEIQIRVLTSFSVKKMRMKMTSARRRRVHASVNCNTLLVHIMAWATIKSQTILEPINCWLRSRSRTKNKKVIFKHIQQLSKPSRIIYYLWQMKCESMYQYIHFTNCVWKCCLQRGSHVVLTSMSWLHPMFG